MALRQSFAVDLDTSNPAADALRVLHANLIACGVISEDDLESRPRLRDARVQERESALRDENRESLRGRRDTARRRSRCTRSTRRARRAVAPNRRRPQRRKVRPCSAEPARRAGMVDRVEQLEQLSGLVAVPGRRRPSPTTTAAWVYWPPFFADARRVAFDIARIERRAVKGRREQQSARSSSSRISCASTAAMAQGRAPDLPRRRSRPTIARWNRCGTLARGRAERRAVVEIGPPVPIAVPGLLLEAPFAAAACAVASRGAFLDRATCARARNTLKRGVAETSRARRSHPCPLPDTVHAVVPIARSHQRQRRVRRGQGSRRAPARSGRTMNRGLIREPWGGRRRRLAGAWDLRETEWPHPTARCRPVVSRWCGPRRRATRRSSEMRVRTPWPE